MGVRINGVWHEELPDPGTGGTDNGNGRNYSSIGDYSNAASGVTWDPSVNPFGGGSSGGVGSGPVAMSGGAPASASALDQQYQKMLQALASGNAEAFQFEKDKFNQQFQEAVREYDLNRSDALSQFAQNFGLSVGQLTGMYNGQPTLAGQLQQAQLSGMYNGLPTEQAREFNQSQYSNLGQSLLNAATQLRGPQDYLQYQQLTRGGQNLLQQLTGNQPIPQTAAPTGQLQSANLGTALSQLGFDPTQVDPRLASLIGAVNLQGGNPVTMSIGGASTGKQLPIGAIGPTDVGAAPPGGYVPPSAVGGPTGGVYDGSQPAGRVPGAPITGDLLPGSWGKMLSSPIGAWGNGGGTGIGGGFTGVVGPPDTGTAPVGGVPPSDSGIYGSTIGGPGLLDTLMGYSGGQRGTGGTPGGPVAMEAPPAGGPALPSTPYTGGADQLPQNSGYRQPTQQPMQQSPQQSILARYGFGAGQSLNPNQINPARWDAMGNIGQSLTKNLAETYYGYDPTDFVNKINAQRPMGTAPRQTRTAYRQPTGLF